MLLIIHSTLRMILLSPVLPNLMIMLCNLCFYTATHAQSQAEFHFQQHVQQCKVVRTVKMFYRLWHVDLGAEELER